jgi:inosose dehydratase
MTSIVLAGAPVSWGVDFAGDPSNPPPSEVLDGIAAAGLEWLELGPPGYLPASADVLAERGLRSVGTFVFDDLHDPRARERVAGAVHDALAALVSFGGRLLVLIDRPCAQRAATAGRARAAVRLDATAWQAMVATIREAAERADALGIRAVFHPHAGSYVEFADEIGRLLADLPAEEVGLCLDTGHALYAGMSPEALVREHRERLEHLHIKDVHASRRRAVIERGDDFWSAVAGGIFCATGDGLLDLESLARALAEAAYHGFATIEQDRRAGSPGTPLDDLRRSVARVRAGGIA